MDAESTFYTHLVDCAVDLIVSHSLYFIIVVGNGDAIRLARSKSEVMYQPELNGLV